MTSLNLKPAHAPVKAYYETLERFGRTRFDNEGNIRGAFEDLLKKCARQFEWFLVPEYQITRTGKHPLRADAALLDAFNLPRAYWEAKDSKDDLRVEMEKKLALGYPRTNMLFQSPTRAILVQNGRIALDADISDPTRLVDILRLFFEYRQPHQEDWDRAVRDFSARIPEIAQGAMKLIDEERKTNRTFVERFNAFVELCRESINPDLKDEAVEEMLVQHLLTERIFRRIFNNPEFTRRNIIAAEIEKVIDSLTKRHFSRDAFLKELDPFYRAIEEAASTTESYSEKQAFLNKVYERFFQGFSKKQADTHGIVYTPQPIVDFMVRSVEELLKSEFGRSLSDKGVHILDPFVGTGNFITRIMQEIRTSALPHKYKEELHCNEVMLLPYYIASMNIEHAYLDKVGEYEPFEGICLVDTFQNMGQAELFSTENTRRFRKQLESPIRIVIANPPYNVGQQSEDEQNKNRQYTARGGVDERVANTYTRDSSATLRNKLSDPYVKAFRWASDRIRDHGIICFVSNSSFIDQIAFDGVRKHIQQDFSKVYVLDLGGNVRKNPSLSGTTHNVFGIQVGVAITIMIRHVGNDTQKPAEVLYAQMPTAWRKENKYSQLNMWETRSSVPWISLAPDRRNTWLTQNLDGDFESFIPIGQKHEKGNDASEALFGLFSLGVVSARDSYVYNFNAAALQRHMRQCIKEYQKSLVEFEAMDMPRPEASNFIDTSNRKIKWSRQTKLSLTHREKSTFSEKWVRHSLYRPFTKAFHYFDDFWNEERYQMPRLFPTEASVNENRTILVKSSGEWPFFVLGTSCLSDYQPQGGSQCFPFYSYDEDGTSRRENITDWSLTQFRTHYGNQSITKWNIFHYTYAILHHPEYRIRYAANLKRELPRIPYAPAFEDYVRIGARLMEIHIHYEQQPEYPLQRTETGKLNWRVEKMKLNKDKTQLHYNDFLALTNIPPEVYEYRLGNRSALEWIIDQYRISTDPRSGITNDPNREDAPEYIVRLIGQVITVSLETVQLVKELSTFPIQ